MPTLLGRLLSVLVVFAVSALLLWWGRLGAPWRRTVALLASVAGLVFLIVALNTQGHRESPTTAAFLVGSSYVTEHASASASLPYYVLTAVCLLLGTAGLAASDQAAHWLARHWMATAVALSVVVTLVRFTLEKVAAPSSMTSLFGVTWLAPIVGAFFFVNLRPEERGVRRLLGCLFLYALLARGFVGGFYVLASTLRLGSHYDVSSVAKVEAGVTGRTYHFQAGSLSQVALLGIAPQLVFWPVYTLGAGLLGAGVAHVLSSSSGRPQRVEPVRSQVEMAADP